MSDYCDKVSAGEDELNQVKIISALMKQTPKKLHILIIYATLAVTTIIAFEQVRLNDFIDYDDNRYVTDNPRVKEGITRKSVGWALTTTDIGYWHPLALLSHILDCELFGLEPSWHHLSSLFLHIANTLLLFWVLKRMTGAVWRSAFVAVLFALHPLHVESVAWVAERKDVLSGLFWMLTMAAYLWYAGRPSIRRYALVFLALGLGLMAKPMLVTLPFVLLLLDYWPLGRFSPPQAEPVKSDYHKSTVYRLIVEKIPLFVLITASCVATYIVPKSRETTTSMDFGPLSSRMANALVSYASYIWKMFYPSRLAVLYPHPGDNLPIWQVIVSLTSLAVLSAVIIYWGRRRRYLLVGWLWYLGTLVPVIGLVQVGAQAMADRYTYLSAIGIFIIVVWSSAELAGRWRYGTVGLGVTAGVVLVMLLICTRAQLRHWQNNITLFGHTLEVTENNYIIHSNYGGALFEEGRFDDALAHFSEALRINPRYADARRNIGIVLLRQGKIDDAIAALVEVLSYRGDWPITHNYLGLAHAQKGELDLAVQNYNAALQLEPDYVDAYKNLGVAHKEQGKTNEAIDKWRAGLEIEPDNPDIHYNIGLVMAEQYKYDEAVSHFNVTLAAKPDWAEAHHNIGAVYYLQGKLDLAARHCSEAIRLSPDYYDAHQNMGMVMTKQGKLDEAIKHFTKALEAVPPHPEVHYNLGGVYYRQGKLKLAAEQCAEALRLRPDYLSARVTLAGILVELGENESAVEHYYRALQLVPDQPYVLKNLAWILATSKDVKPERPDDALKFAVRACELTGYTEPEYLDTLAAAYAAAGKFSEAVETATKAVKLAEAKGTKVLPGKIRHRLELYKAGQNYLAEPSGRDEVAPE
ncbi:MAG: tetratricopeptide repeat protein [Planctomycetota bacterium]|nr:MAG: tetratricopeptide repeat protein [Planctomycetota bacterium]